MRPFLSVANVLGRMLMVFSILYLMPIACSPIYEDGTIRAFLLGMLPSLGAGALLYLLTLRRREELKPRDGFALVTLSCLGCALYLWQRGVYPTCSEALRQVSFNLVSIATDCGFASTDYGQWPIFVPLLMLFLSSVTASSGSTGGGIKMVRTLTLARQSSRELSPLLHPTLAAPVTIGGTIVPNAVVFAVLGFIFLYFMSIVVLTFLLILGGLDFITAFTAVIACINNAGPGLGQVGPASNYAGLTDYETWVCSFTMLLGRLEVFSILILFTPGFWRR